MELAGKVSPRITSSGESSRSSCRAMEHTGLGTPVSPPPPPPPPTGQFVASGKHDTMATKSKNEGP